MSSIRDKDRLESREVSFSTSSAPDLTITTGRVYIYFAFDLGLSINLKECSRLLASPRESAAFRHTRKTPKYFDYNPLPFRISQEAKTFCFIGSDYCTRDNVDITIYDFGSISVAYKIDIRGSFSNLVPLSALLYENDLLLLDATKRVEEIYRELQPAIVKPQLSEISENYLIFDVGSFKEEITPDELLSTYGPVLGQILRSEQEPCSKNEIRNALACKVSYTPHDITLIDWNNAFLYGSDTVDVRAVLEFANVELLEMRYQDNELDEALESAYQALTSGRSVSTDMKRIAELQVDSAMMYEGVNNALKLLGDQYLARVYSLVSRRFHLTEWDASILRKLETLNSIYTKMSDRASQTRSETMEIIVILLIACEILIAVFVH